MQCLQEAKQTGRLDCLWLNIASILQGGLNSLAISSDKYILALIMLEKPARTGIDTSDDKY